MFWTVRRANVITGRVVEVGRVVGVHDFPWAGIVRTEPIKAS